MFTIHFAETEPREISRKANAVKVAERDGALYVESPAGEIVWGSKPEPAKADKPSDRKPYNLDGSTAAADIARAEAVAAKAAALEGVEMVPAETIEEGDIVVGRRTRGEAAREVAEIRIGKRWVTAWDEKGSAFLYVPIGSPVGRVVA
ncbi:hypothetical protein ACIRN4_23895 [Pimelobacter simplex]|uniref:hypothetical protein n=1 Tax=Nocardioides simplex TaxID=2045 RepID=UPI0038156997